MLLKETTPPKTTEQKMALSRPKSPKRKSGGKRKASAYIKFYKDFYPKFMKAHPNATVVHAAKAAGAEWRRLHGTRKSRKSKK
jgi:hypothetical protein